MKNYEKLKFMLKKIKWREQNKHNFTEMGNNFLYDSVLVGNNTYGKINVINYDSNTFLKIGHYCSIANDVTFILGGDHKYNYISTYPFEDKLLNHKSDKIYYSKGDIVIKDDVWISHGVTILSGVTIGQGAIIGAKATVCKDVPPYAIYVGTEVLKYRFNQKIIEKLLKLDYSKIDKEFIEENKNFFYDNPEESLEKLLKKI